MHHALDIKNMSHTLNTLNTLNALQCAPIGSVIHSVDAKHLPRPGLVHVTIDLIHVTCPIQSLK